MNAPLISDLGLSKRFDLLLNHDNIAERSHV